MARPMIVFQITTRADWEASVGRGIYEADSLAAEGFIHCSTADQYLRVADRFYRDVPDLVLLAIDTDALSAPLKMERADGEDFPHVYGPIELHAVCDVGTFERGEDGSFLPGEPEFFAVFGERTLEQAKDRARAVMEGFPEPWWIAGGWAIDCFIGEKTRPHADLEVVVLRPAVPAVWTHLASWRDVRTPVEHGVLQRWSGEPLRDEIHQVWARQGKHDAMTWQDFARDPTAIDILIDDGDAERWKCRRDPTITLPIDDMGARTSDGTPYVRPEVQLLYKAKHSRWKDQRDFTRVLPELEEQVRAWLHDALARAYGPTHPWLERL